MKEVYIRDIINLIGGTLVYGDLNNSLKKFVKDTNDIEKDDSFIGIKGEHFDGSLFYEKAFLKGAETVIIDKNSFENNSFKVFNGKNLIVVNDTLSALQKIAAYKRSLYDIPVIGVTGSVGKTSTKDMIASVLSEKYKVLKTDKNYNNEIGLPLTILNLTDEEVLVLEMGMNHFGEIDKLSKIAKPTIGVITNIGTAHIGILGSRENILKAKLEIINGIDKNGVLFVNADNDIISKHLDYIKDKCKTLTYSFSEESDFKGEVKEVDAFNGSFSINEDIFDINVGGEAFLYNALVAYCIGKYLGLTNEEIKEGLNRFNLTENRLEKIINKRGTTIINDTYNASLDSVVNAIRLLNDSHFNRKILVFGDILELGDYEKEIHEKIGENILSSNIDIVILVGNNVKYTYDYLKSNNFGKSIYLFDREDETYDLLNNLLTKEDIILLKGSHGMNLINVVNTIKNY